MADRILCNCLEAISRLQSWLQYLGAVCKLNHCYSTVIQCIVIVLNDVTCKSREQRLITQEHIATHVNLILLFKPALYSSTLVVIKLFESSIKLFYAKIIGQSPFISFTTCLPWHSRSSQQQLHKSDGVTFAV